MRPPRAATVSSSRHERDEVECGSRAPALKRAVVPAPEAGTSAPPVELAGLTMEVDRVMWVPLAELTRLPELGPTSTPVRFEPA